MDSSQPDFWFEEEFDLLCTKGSTVIQAEPDDECELGDDDFLLSDDDLVLVEGAEGERVRPAVPPPIRNWTFEDIQAALAEVGFEIESRIDDQASSRVYQARRVSNGARVAIKVLIEEPRDTSSAVPRFRQEARLMTALRHPNLVHALAHGSVAGIHYVVLELAEGRNLKTWIEEDGPAPVERAANIAWQAAEVLEYIHQQGVIHRDVKPSNLMLCRDGRLKLLDLGLAREPVGDASITLLFKDRLLGTPDFMAPEQALECHEVDARADLYALGCTLYYLLAGRPPMVGRNLVESLLMHQNEKAVPITTVRPEVPAELGEVCARLMARRPADRYETAAAAAAALAPWATCGS